MPGKCPRCAKAVYFAEEKIVLGKPYHNMCVKCGNCNKLLDSGSVTDHQDEIYCKSCYGRLFGPKGYGYGMGAGVLSMDDGTKYQNGPPRSNVPSTLEAYIAPLKSNVNNSSSNTTTTSIITATKEGSGTTNNNNTIITREATTSVVTKSSSSDNVLDNNIRNSSSNSRPLTNFNPGNRPAFTPLPAYNPLQPANAPRWGGGTYYCTRCNKCVFMAERVMAAGGAWHKACFTCQQCNKRLDSHSIREHERDIYCNPCYGKNFGPKGYMSWSAAKVS